MRNTIIYSAVAGTATLALAFGAGYVVGKKASSPKSSETAFITPLTTSPMTSIPFDSSSYNPSSSSGTISLQKSISHPITVCESRALEQRVTELTENLAEAANHLAHANIFGAVISGHEYWPPAEYPKGFGIHSGSICKDGYSNPVGGVQSCLSTTGVVTPYLGIQHQAPLQDFRVVQEARVGKSIITTSHYCSEAVVLTPNGATTEVHFPRIPLYHGENDLTLYIRDKQGHWDRSWGWEVVFLPTRSAAQEYLTWKLEQWVRSGVFGRSPEFQASATRERTANIHKVLDRMFPPAVN